jgi:hypothetical protein
MQTNPTCHLKRSELWGFEVSHIIVSFGVMMLTNIICSALKLPVFASWIVGLGCLAVLRLLSIGKKAGHMGFVALYLTRPRLYLGGTLRFARKDTTKC